MDRIILHCDLNNFFASVECAENPSITSKYVAVSGNAESRHGIILAKNTTAKNMGVKTGEAIWQAKQKCPELVCVPPHYEQYHDYSQRAKAIYLKYTNFVESFGLDECWLDVTNCKIFGDGFEIAEKIRKEVKQTLGITISVGVSFCKVFSKLGSDMKKPDATTVISKQNFKQLVWPLDVSEMLFIGKKTKAKLSNLGIYTIGDLANANEKLLTKTFGVNGQKMQNCARGLDDEPVAMHGQNQKIKSVGHGTTTKKDMATFEDAELVIEYLAELVATRLRRYGLEGSTIHLNIRKNDLTHVSKQSQISHTFVSKNISKSAISLLHSIWNPKKDLPLRSMTVSMHDLSPIAFSQESIFDVAEEKKQRLEFAVDQIRKKYGDASIKKALFLNNELISDKYITEEDLLPFKRTRQ